VKSLTRGLAGLLTLLTLMPLVLAGTASAQGEPCKCTSYSSEKAKYQAAARNGQLIYIGKVAARYAPTAEEPELPYGYDFTVTNPIKGQASSPDYVSTDSGSCGLKSYTVGTRVLVVQNSVGRIDVCDGTTHSSVDSRAQIIRDTLSPSPTPRPTPSRTSSPTPKPSVTPKPSPTPSPVASPTPTLSPSPTAAPTSASPLPSVLPSSEEPSATNSPDISLNTEDGDDGLPLVQVVIAGALGVLALVGGVVLFRVTRPPV
jgi:hypothetical protein